VGGSVFAVKVGQKSGAIDTHLGHIKSEKISLSASILLGIGKLQEESLSSLFSDFLYLLQRER
jgi:hypothetical protein